MKTPRTRRTPKTAVTKAPQKRAKNYVRKPRKKSFMKAEKS